MIYNATLLRIDLPVVTGGGDVTYPSPGAAMNNPVCLDRPTSRQRWDLQTLKSDADATLYIDPAIVIAAAAAASLSPASAVLVNAQVRVQVNGQATPGTYMVRVVNDLSGGPLPHFECFIKTL